MTDPRRAAVLKEARSWLGTPYHHMGRVKGVGCDCLTLLVSVYHATGVVPEVEIPHYPPDWHLHRSDELYLEGLLAYAREIALARRQLRPQAGEEQKSAAAAPALLCDAGEGIEGAIVELVQAGDVALFRFGRCFSHGAIIVDWPTVIHAWHVGGVILTDAGQPFLVRRPVRFFSPFGALPPLPSAQAGEGLEQA
jgi:cell wall-associated NlpC family hydrolase